MKKVFAGSINTVDIFLSQEIGRATSLYLVAPDLPYEIEIDIFLQLEISPLENRRIRLQENLLTLDTETLIYIPREYQVVSLPKRIAIVTSDDLFVEIWALYSSDFCDTDLENRINDLDEKLKDLLLINQAVAVNQLAQDVAIGALAGSLGGVLLPITGGASAAIPSATIPALQTGAAALSGLAPGLAFLP